MEPILSPHSPGLVPGRNGVNSVTSPFLLPAGLFLAAALISTAFASQHAVALRTLRETVIEPLLFFAMLTLFSYQVSGRTRAHSLLLMALALVATGLGPAIIGLGQSPPTVLTSWS